MTTYELIKKFSKENFCWHHLLHLSKQYAQVYHTPFDKDVIIYTFMSTFGRTPTYGTWYYDTRGFATAKSINKKWVNLMRTNKIVPQLNDGDTLSFHRWFGKSTVCYTDKYELGKAYNTIYKSNSSYQKFNLMLLCEINGIKCELEWKLKPNVKLRCSDVTKRLSKL